jgi:ATP-dependent DNA helicase DinG
MSNYIDRVFTADGLLAGHFPGYKPRSQQIELARAVDHAFSYREHLLAEGPTGVGKTLATLVPAIYHASQVGKTVVIATATIVLQEQIVDRDLPLLQEVLPFPFTYALIKGKNNYLCLDRYHEMIDRGAGRIPVEPEVLSTVANWAETTETGNKAELDFEIPDTLWNQICGQRDECDADRCIDAGCFAQQAREAARGADIIVTNYSLLFSHVKIRQETHQDVILPPFDLIVCDEGHEMADIARDWFGFRVTRFAIHRLGRALIKANQHDLARELQGAANGFFQSLRTYEDSDRYRVRIRESNCVDGRRLLAALGRHRDYWKAACGGTDSDREKRRIRRRVGLSKSLIERLGAVLSLEDTNEVFWIEKDEENRLAVCGKPIHVSHSLKRQLFDEVESAVVTSATLATAGRNFNYIRGQVGLEGGRELIVKSPFDFHRQVLFVVPSMANGVNDISFPGEMAIETRKVLDAIGGKTLGLFTSWKNLHAVHERLIGNGHRVLLQGEQPRSQLIRIFKEDVHSVLLGTASFWTGVDIPGEALSCVVIDKIPFPTPDDPIMDALAEREKDWFIRHFIPRAAIKLRQGFGRLIRTHTDVGVVVLFDNRILTKPYGKIFLRSLPDCRTSRRLEAIPLFLGSHTPEGCSSPCP